jgi:hypothetical protein
MVQWEYCALSNDGATITYLHFQRDGVHQQQTEMTADEWASAIAVLGDSGWEAINVNDVYTPQEITIWRFKRVIHPKNLGIRLGGA